MPHLPLTCLFTYISNTVNNDWQTAPRSNVLHHCVSRSKQVQYSAWIPQGALSNVSSNNNQLCERMTHWPWIPVSAAEQQCHAHVLLTSGWLQAASTYYHSWRHPKHIYHSTRLHMLFSPTTQLQHCFSCTCSSVQLYISFHIITRPTGIYF